LPARTIKHAQAAVGRSALHGLVPTATPKAPIPDQPTTSQQFSRLVDGLSISSMEFRMTTRRTLFIAAPAFAATLAASELALLLLASGCSSISRPGPQTVVGMSPDATVSMTEIIAVGAAGGEGTLTFRGNSYPFQLAGGVTGGGGAANTRAYGEVYNLHNLTDFKGLYRQNSGGPGLVLSGASNLWLRNAAGVVLHLQGTQEGVTLSLGGEEVLIEML
jgi:hypothetical protein